MKKPHIVGLGANPAYQKTLFFEHFRPGEVNRVTEMQIFASGKGINFCRAGNLYGKADFELIQFAGGENGAFIEQELRKEGLPNRTVRTGGNTRCCSTCLCRKTGIMTEIIEPSTALTEDEFSRGLEEVGTALENADGFAICGTLPSGTDKSFYRLAGELAVRRGIPVLADAYINMEELLAMDGRIFLKINREELSRLTGKSDPVSGLQELQKKYPSIRCAAITDGPEQAWLNYGNDFFVYTLPELEKIVNPIGCGDTASAVWFSELLRQTPPEEAFRFALGAASANCLDPMGGKFDVKVASSLAGKITVKKTK